MEMVREDSGNWTTAVVWMQGAEGPNKGMAVERGELDPRNVVRRNKWQDLNMD